MVTKPTIRLQFVTHDMIYHGYKVAHYADGVESHYWTRKGIHRDLPPFNAQRGRKGRKSRMVFWKEGRSFFTQGFCQYGRAYRGQDKRRMYWNV